MSEHVVVHFEGGYLDGASQTINRRTFAPGRVWQHPYDSEGEEFVLRFGDPGEKGPFGGRYWADRYRFEERDLPNGDVIRVGVFERTIK